MGIVVAAVELPATLAGAGVLGTAAVVVGRGVVTAAAAEIEVRSICRMARGYHAGHAMGAAGIVVLVVVDRARCYAVDAPAARPTATLVGVRVVVRFIHFRDNSPSFPE